MTDVTTAQAWLDDCIASDGRDISHFAQVGIGAGSNGLYVGVTWLPGGTQGVALTREDAAALSDRLIYAAEALRRAGDGDD